ncbi:unnamed protein product [Amoebophrya sp. A25]|nr:unnamed protein product [Amoebophrya sp. A25]|eukprot:GSA25T00006171001.1
MFMLMSHNKYEPKILVCLLQFCERVLLSGAKPQQVGVPWLSGGLTTYYLELHRRVLLITHRNKSKEKDKKRTRTMSGFFGVTSLGPAQPIGCNLLSTLGVTSFSDNDFKKAFYTLADREGKINRIDVYECMTRTYGFEPMPEEINIFVSTMKLHEDGVLTWEEFSGGLKAIREKVKKIGKRATHYDSYKDYSDDLRKHARVKFGPMEVYKRPMTTAQAVGWHEEEVFIDRFPKQSCAETKYQDEVVKSGWIV